MRARRLETIARKSVRTGLLILFTGLLPVGCRTPAPVEPPVFAPNEIYRPEIGLVYHPFGPAFTQDLARPVPNYQGWTSERMDRDLRRMAGCGSDFVLAVIKLDDITEDELNRYAEFFGVAERLGGSAPRIALLITTERYDRTKMAAILEWLVNSPLLGHSAWYRLGGKPLIVLGPGLNECRERHPALTFRRATDANSEWRWQLEGGPAALRLSKNKEQVFIRAGLVVGDTADGTYTWALPRNKGNTLKYFLWQAAQVRAPIICISSWNDFASGDFIEPNSLDGNQLMNRLQEELGRIRQLAPVPVK